MSRVPISEEQANRMMADQQRKQESADANQEQREHVLRAVLSPEARERLKRIEQVKPERAMAVENNIIMGVRSGKMQPPISDEIVRDMLSQLAGGGGAGGSNITVVRKKNDDDW